ncbi:MAG: gliding motility protein GldC [Flavobacteriales bacterium]|nr:gliding motility protein GldC [Flavobacteriales bacterium]
MSHTSEIKFEIQLDDNKVPERMSWNASDGGVTDEEAKAVMMSVWDPKSKETLRIDLWSKDMLLDEMKIFYHQTLMGMADSFERATNDKEVAQGMRMFAEDFAKRLRLIDP